MIKTLKDYSVSVAEEFNRNSPVPGFKVSPSQVMKVLKFFFSNMEQVLQMPNGSVMLSKYIKINCDLKALREHNLKQRKRFLGY